MHGFPKSVTCSLRMQLVDVSQNEAGRVAIYEVDGVKALVPNGGTVRVRVTRDPTFEPSGEELEHVLEQHLRDSALLEVGLGSFVEDLHVTREKVAAAAAVAGQPPE